LRQKTLRTAQAYSAVYSEHFPLNVWPVVALFIRAAESAITRAHKATNITHVKVFASWRGPLAFFTAARITGTFAFTHNDIVAINPNQLCDVYVDDCWSLIKQAIGTPRASRITEVQFINAAISARKAWGILGDPTDGMRALPLSPEYLEAQSRKPAKPESEPFLSAVNALLPPQPWEIKTHLKIAEALSANPTRVSKAIKVLIARGDWQQQRDGVVNSSSDNIERNESKVGGGLIAAERSDALLVDKSAELSIYDIDELNTVMQPITIFLGYSSPTATKLLQGANSVCQKVIPRGSISIGLKNH
jgi:hypothetical protein